MADILRAMSMAGAILLLVVAFIAVISIAAVRRGEMEMNGAHDAKGWWNTGVSTGPSGAAARPMTSADISVLQILGVGTGLFVLAVLLLFLVSVVQHL